MDDIQIDPTVTLDPGLRILGQGRLSVGPYAVIEPHVLIDLGTSGRGIIEVGARAKLKFGTVLRAYNGSIRIGTRSSLGEYGVWAGHGGITVGSNVIVGPHCTATASEHIFESEIPIRFQGERVRGISIEDDSWLGAGVHVLDGVSIGRGAVVGAGSVVTRSVEENSLAFGSPARGRRKRERHAFNFNH
jgi:acetyltransferase-like isoleucine patch superfamily enzyme